MREEIEVWFSKCLEDENFVRYLTDVVHEGFGAPEGTTEIWVDAEALIEALSDGATIDDFRTGEFNGIILGHGGYVITQPIKLKVTK